MSDAAPESALDIPAVLPTIRPGEGQRPPSLNYTPKLSGQKKQRFGPDAILGLLTTGSALLVLLMMAALIFILTYAAMPSVKARGIGFLTGTQWNEQGALKRNAEGKIIKHFDSNHHLVVEREATVFGALPFIYGTAVSSIIALLFALPLSFGASLFLVRIAPLFLVGPVSFLIEFLAAIPSIAYGIWGAFVFCPFVAEHIEPPLNWLFAHVPGLNWLHWEGGLNGNDMFCGGLILGIMVLPIITAVSRDVLRAVPRVQIEGTLALGATWWQSSWEMLRYSRSGLFGSVMLGLARAAGETMAVTMVIGNFNGIHSSPFGPAQTMSSLLANTFAESSENEKSPLLEVALILLVMSLLFNVVARYLVVGKSARTSAGH